MRKLFLVIAITMISLTLMGGIALAGGWTNINPTTNSPSTGYWMTGVGGSGSPHSGFSTTTNQCRVCHAVHMAGANSWRLLNNGELAGLPRGGTSRATECDYCHGASGATVKRPYGPKNYTVYGEHTLNSTIIPDGSGTMGAGGLSCGDCHSVHGGNTVSAAGYSSKILKLDPNKDGTNMAANATGAAPDNSNDNRAISNYCADCHNQNPNWDTNGTNDNVENAGRLNNRSHVQGEAAEGSLEVYGTLTDVAGYTGAAQRTTTGCKSCHSAAATGNSVASLTDSSATASAFPHQTKGAKLMADTYTTGTVQQAAGATGSGSNTNDAGRVLPAMDQICGSCHTANGAFGGGAGVGITY